MLSLFPFCYCFSFVIIVLVAMYYLLDPGRFCRICTLIEEMVYMHVLWLSGSYMPYKIYLLNYCSVWLD